MNIYRREWMLDVWREVVLETLRSKVLKQFRTRHLGVERMKPVAKSYVCWPLIGRHIMELVGECTQCQQAAKFNKKIMPVSRPRPGYPWSRVHVNFVGPINATTYVVAIPKWSEILPIMPPTTKTIQLLTDFLPQWTT